MRNRLYRVAKRAARTHNGDETGLTLVELLIATALFTVVLIVMLQLINNFYSSSTRVSASQQASSSSMVAMNRIGKDIRNGVVQATASPILSASPSQLTLLTTDGNGNDIEATFNVTPNSGTSCPCTLTETSAPYSLSTSTTTASATQRLVVNNLTSTQVFSYYPAPATASPTGSTMALPTTTSIPSTGVTTPPIGNIESVGVTLVLQPVTNEPTITVSAVFEMRNVAATVG